MRLVDQHVGEIGRAKSVVVPGIGIGGAQGAGAVWKVGSRGKLPRVGIALVAARAGADDQEAVGIAVGRAWLEAGPVAARVAVGEQSIGGDVGVGGAAECAVEINRGCPRGPYAKRCAAGREGGAGWRGSRNILLRQHGSS